MSEMKDKAFVTFLMLNDSFLPGALMLAYALREQKTSADIVCMVTDEITPDAKRSLGLLFDYVVPVVKIYIPHRRRQERQDRPFLFTRLNALRLGKDGDLGFQYEKIVLLDADVLPLKNYNRLFELNTPAGIPNEDKTKSFDAADTNRANTTRWGWHATYEKICPHGHPIPKELTDRVITDAENMGVNSSLLVIQPSLHEFRAVLENIKSPEVNDLVGDKFSWPEMQYLTMWWSGRWHSIDIKYCGFYGYPNLEVLNGTHYAGIKPWYFGRDAKAVKRYSRYEDFRYWFGKYKNMLQDYPELGKMRRLNGLLEEIMKMQAEQ